jgi:hypothetical protein
MMSSGIKKTIFVTVGMLIWLAGAVLTMRVFHSIFLLVVYFVIFDGFLGVVRKATINKYPERAKAANIF